MGRKQTSQSLSCGSDWGNEHRLISSTGEKFGGRYVCRTRLAETEGFEPSVREFPVRRFSKPLVSATHPRLRMRLRKRRLYKAVSPGFNRRQSGGIDLEPHVEAHLLARLEHAHAELRPFAPRAH